MKSQTLNHFFKPVNLKGKENEKNITPLPHVDPKKAQLKKKNDLNNESIQLQERSRSNNKMKGNKKSSEKDEILDHLEKTYLLPDKDEKLRSTTPIKKNKKKESEMEIEEPINYGLKVVNKNSLLKQKKNSTPIKIRSDEGRQGEEVMELQEPSAGIKKKKLTKLSEKQEKKKANVKPTKKQKAIMLVDSNTEESQQSSESEEDSVKGDVEFVDDEVDNLQNNKKIDKMFQNKLKFKESKQVQQPEKDQKILLANFLHNNNNQSPSESTKLLQKNLEMINLNDTFDQGQQDDEEDSYNSDEERIRKIEELQKQKALNQQKVNIPIRISDSPIKKLGHAEKDDLIEIEDDTIDENKIINIESSEDLVASTFQDMKFYFVGAFKNYDKNLISYIISENQGQVMGSASKNQQQFYNVIGTKNVDFTKYQKLKEQNYPILQESEFIELLEKTLKMSMAQITEIYSESKKMQEENEEKQNKKQKQQVSIPATMTSSQKVEVKTQKEEVQAQRVEAQSTNNVVAAAAAQKPKPKQEQKSMVSLLSSFLPKSISTTEQEGQQDLSFEIISENSKNISQSEVTQTKPNKLFTKEKLSKSVKAITYIDECDDLEIIDDNFSKKQNQKMEIEKKPAVKRILAEPKLAAKTKINSEDYNENIQALWTHKYSPKELKDCVGNENVIKKLENWLVNWENVVIHKQKSQGNWKENPNARACLISGPPGIGKTSTVRLLAQKLNMNIIEWNASDVRSKNALETIVNPLKDNQVLNFNFTASSQRSIILMDEVDGMSSGDIGGNQSLIKIIKDTKNPIFCVCNDRYSQKLRSLSTHCFDVRFYKPNKSQVAKRLLEVCQKEGIKSDINTLELLTEGVNVDIRQSLNLLQMYSKRSKEISYKLLINGLSSFKKDEQVSMSPFEAAKVLTTKIDFDRMSLQKKLDLFFLDYEFVPMLIHENYLSSVQIQKQNDASVSELEKLVDATNAMSESDVLGNCIRSGGNWSLLQNVGFLSSVYVPDKVCSKNNNYPQMSQILGKMSSQRKTHRLIRELHMKLSQDITGNNKAVQFDYVQPLMELIMNHLEQGKEGVDKVVDIMANYNITPEILKEHLILIQFKSNIEERLKAVPIATKTLLTKTYNKRFKDDIKLEKKAKQDDDNEKQVKYDDILGEIDEIDIIEEDEGAKEDDDTTASENMQKSQNSTKQQSQASTKSQPQKAKAQTTKNVKQSKTEVQQKNQMQLFTKSKK